MPKIRSRPSCRWTKRVRANSMPPASDWSTNDGEQRYQPADHENDYGRRGDSQCVDPDLRWLFAVRFVPPSFLRNKLTSVAKPPSATLNCGVLYFQMVRSRLAIDLQVCSSSPFAATQRGNSCPRHRAEGIRQCHHAGWRFDEPAKARDRRHRPARGIRAIDKTVQRSVRARLQQLLDPDHRHLSKSAAAHGRR